MPVMIQVRNVPDELHRRLKSKAALAGQSLSDYVLRHLKEAAETPTLEEFRARLHARDPVIPKVSPTDILREERDGR